jgi:choline dehydrogenase-like flavoprotein
MYAANSYYTPNARRPNLMLLTGAQATKIVLGKNQLATGVEYTVNNTTYTAQSSKEVILAAGSKFPSASSASVLTKRQDH